MENKFQNEEEEIDLGELAGALLKKWWMILAAAMVGMAAAVLVTALLISPRYESSAMLYILSKTTSVTSLADLQLGSELTADFEVIAKSKPVLDAAAEKILAEAGKEFTREDLEEMITVSNQADTRILVITAAGESPTDACLVANAVSQATAEQMAYIMKSDPPTTVEEAEVSEEPVSPSLIKNGLLGFAAGFLLLSAVLAAQFLINDRIRTEEDVERYLGAPVLAAIPAKRKNQRKKEKEVELRGKNP